jgi:hypothetical protein
MSIIKMMDRLNPKELLWFHRHRKFDPDCYGIDMAKLED